MSLLVSWRATVGVAFLTCLPIVSNAASQEGPPRSDLLVTVSAAESERVADALETLASSGDPLVANLSDWMLQLAYALASKSTGRGPYGVGPLTAREQKIVDLPAYFSRFSDPRGVIRLQLKLTWLRRDRTVYAFTVPGFLDLLAAVAKGPFVQAPALQREQLLCLGRMILNFNSQAGSVIPKTDIMTALAGGFGDAQVAGLLASTVKAMVEVGGSYDLVPPERAAQVLEVAGLDLLVPRADAPPAALTVRYAGREHITTAGDLTWSLLRFFAGDKSRDRAWRADARERSALGLAILRHLQAQVDARRRSGEPRG